MDNTPQWLEPVPAQPVSPPQRIRQGHGILHLKSPLHDRVLAAKNEIDRIAPVGQWDDAKKLTNTYEYIFLSLQRRMSRSVSETLPLSRSYFKMIEMWNLLEIQQPNKTAHAAEGPGGFLEAIQDRTEHATPMTAMTLRSMERSVPGWRKSAAFLQRHPMVTITYGPDNTGNLYNLENQDAFAAIAAPADIYTADGGFDFSADFNGQENTVQRLLVAEILAGFQTLAPAPSGTMIIKIFDTNNRSTLELLWLTSSCFEATALIKPQTSRPANSERYWVGRGFRGAPEWIINLLRRLTATDAPHGWDTLFAEPPMTASWLQGLIDFQTDLETVQLSKIQLTLNIIKYTTREEIRGLLLENIKHSRAWCQRNGVPTNPLYAEMSDDEITSLNLEEALVPFQASVARTNLQALSRLPQTHRASIASPSPRPPTVPAWRTALPASVLGRAPSQTDGDNQSCEPPAQAEPPAPHDSDLCSAPL